MSIFEIKSAVVANLLIQHSNFTLIESSTIDNRIIFKLSAPDNISKNKARKLIASYIHLQSAKKTLQQATDKYNQIVANINQINNQ